MINLNETGAFLWIFLSEEHTAEEAVNALCNEYEVERERAALDVDKFITVIQTNNFSE